MPLSDFTLALSVLNFVGSVLSSIGSGFIIVCYLVLPIRRHFRHVHILNLAIADFINATNNSASGSLILIRRENLSRGPACILNGFVTQISVQATDTAILAITTTTVYTITRISRSHAIQTEWSNRAIVLTCIAIWILPAITSFLALGMHWYGPVSGNWCWLVEKPSFLRYVLTHGWRYLFMLVEICLSLYLYVFLRRHFRALRVPMISSVPANSIQSPTFSPMSFTNSNTEREQKRDLSETYDAPINVLNSHNTVVISASRPSMASQMESPRYKAVQRILLLNAYPFFYIILWIPGLANRIVEASGHSSKIAQILQASTQFVGLANAITYGWNERIARELRRKYFRRN
ncbi:hypothetical protein BDN71DRAFT_1511848 [Pleurotus eryngii]|uniref:G-protein coupled receptors family 1 profile domain-containing protein n=1 Tax=Pleurotus eryngii TaxID=5323 RepID=A0A9P5ZLS8_PLEER|nr:hypothetical protein BDN71DRAFT_1511848 [Pleurotus eryngii]